ncbi:hypothetical protein LWI28_003556 [Acer negundo]|uniref:Uncharacterized protein n=1 Tax=Acer negundo TaxID=4023 RepID=A0AAD5NQM3_ACENE|nr:hypothetical protein LWI28_003556 [Acer negundo]KAK4846916.1 hypothetical protein QYF36_023240 [Acer negundo]
MTREKGCRGWWFRGTQIKKGAMEISSMRDPFEIWLDNWMSAGRDKIAQMVSFGVGGQFLVESGEIGEKMGYRVKKGKSNGVVGLGKLGRVMLLVEIMEIAPNMLVVELKVVGGGGVGLEFDDLYWEDLQVGLQVIVHSWHKTNVDVMMM